MTPDTAAWRALADAAKRPLMPHMGFREQVALDRARKDAAYALCDAADEVERLRAEVNAKQSWIDGAKVDLDGYADDQAEYEVAVGAIAADLHAARTALTALVADLRALHAPRTQVMSGSSEPKHVPMTRQVCSFCGDNYGNAPYPCATAALLDRHAPEEGS